MKALTLTAFVSLCLSTGWTQPATPPAGEKGDTVVGTFEDGGKLTLDEYNGLLRLHPTWQGHPREEVIHSYAIIRRAAQMAQEKKLNEKSPYKEELDFDILYSMANMLVQDVSNSMTVDHAEIETYYNQHKEIFKQVKVSGLKVAFSSGASPAGGTSTPVMASTKKALTEDEAKAKAEKLVAQIRAGADFGKLVLLESDDETTKTKGGELGTWKLTDNVPDLMRAKVLALNQGEVSDPVQQGPGFYIFHADAITYSPLKDVEDTIFAQLKQQHTQEWMQNFDKSTKVVFPDKNEQNPAPAAPSDPKK
jgi:peptidyl-prolyl cis-trans isomerase C